MSHTSSRTWVSDPEKEKQRHRALSANFRRAIGPAYQKVVPTQYSDWIKHQYKVSEDRVMAERRKFRRMTGELDLPTKVDIAAFRGRVGKLAGGNRSAVLAEKTVWCVNYVEGRRASAAVWPSSDEYEHEGHGRAMTGFQRKLPLMRARLEANDTVNWKLLPAILPLPFDDLCKPPTFEDLYTPAEQFQDEESLLTQELLAALDDDTIYRI